MYINIYQLRTNARTINRCIYISSSELRTRLVQTQLLRLQEFADAGGCGFKYY